MSATVLSMASLAGATGRGVRVAVIDSGVSAAHPHVPGVAAAVGFDRDGRQLDEAADRLGHGTAVAAAIREKAPAAELLVARVFDRELRTTAEALVAALEWAVGERARLVNLSLGTSNPEHERPLGGAVASARAAGVTVVAAAPHDGTRWLPGALPGVVAVTLDWTLPRESCVIDWLEDGGADARASGYPRPIPGVPPEKNLRGVSFAVANVTGLLARLWSVSSEV
jgi:subtilisin family serine protease